MGIRHIVWDWNGTLLDDLWLSIKAINIVLKRYSLPEITEEKYLDIFTFPVVNYYKLLGFDFNKHPFEVVGTEFIEEYTRFQQKPQLHHGARKLMSEISNRGITQSLLSAARKKMLDTLMDHHNLLDYFTNVIGQNDHYAYGKTEAGREWVNELHYNAPEVLFVGDTIHDLDVANEIGADCVLLSHGHTSLKRLKKTGALVFTNFDSLQKWLIKKLDFS